VIFDVFFISYDEPNCEQNWQQLLTFHPKAKRIHGIQGINISHMICHDMSTTNKFWTVDGDNWLLRDLNITTDKFWVDIGGNQWVLKDLNINEEETELITFDSVDCIDKVPSGLGSIKLWTKNKIINNNMSKGDFCKNATSKLSNSQTILSEHRYNTTPYSTWKNSFRLMVKCYSYILPNVLEQNIKKYQQINQLDDGKNNAIWGYRASLDAKKYVEQCNGDFDKINLINNYDWLETKFNVCVVDWQKL
jgi:hypothetical protein